MGINTQHRQPQSTWRVLLAFLCVLLVAISGTVQVAHSHPDANASHADCALCATAHVAVEVVAAPAPAPAVAVISKVEALPVSLVASAPYPFALFTRPPPVDAVSA